MERLGAKTRDIRFYSAKNDCMVCVHSRQARDYAKFLEEQTWVERYEANTPLDAARYVNLSPVDIRPGYFKTAWATDFLLTYADGRKGVRELVQADALKKRAVVERLEFSRRYWQVQDVNDWKVVLVA